MNAQNVTDKTSFIHFVNEMLAEFESGAHNWENVTLADFLESMAAWAGDWQKPTDANPWRHAAVLLAMGADYE